jgi:hypothetical protein
MVKKSNPTTEKYPNTILVGDRLLQIKKPSKASVENIAKQMVSYANTKGGEILLPMAIITKGKHRTKEMLQNAMTVGSYCSPEIKPTVKIRKLGGQEYLSITVKESKNILHSFKGKTYVQNPAGLGIINSKDYDSFKREEKFARKHVPKSEKPLEGLTLTLDVGNPTEIIFCRTKIRLPLGLFAVLYSLAQYAPNAVRRIDIDSAANMFLAELQLPGKGLELQLNNLRKLISRLKQKLKKSVPDSGAFILNRKLYGYQLAIPKKNIKIIIPKTPSTNPK